MKNIGYLMFGILILIVSCIYNVFNINNPLFNVLTNLNYLFGIILGTVFLLETIKKIGDKKWELENL